MTTTAMDRTTYRSIQIPAAIHLTQRTTTTMAATRLTPKPEAISLDAPTIWAIRPIRRKIGADIPRTPTTTLRITMATRPSNSTRTTATATTTTTTAVEVNTIPTTGTKETGLVRRCWPQSRQL